MKRILIATIIVALNGLVLSPIRCSADSLPSKKEAAAVIARAIDRLRLTMPGSPPFHFVAKLHYTVGSHAADGTYEVLWAAPDRFRLELSLGATRESDLVLKDKWYVLRNSPSMAYLLERVIDAISIPGIFPKAFEYHVAKIYAGQQGPENLLCFGMRAPMDGRTVCLDSKKGDLVSDVLETKHGYLKVSYKSEGFADFGTARYSQHTVSKIGDESLDVQVEKLAPVLRFEDSVFVPPAGSLSFDWCAEGKLKRPHGDELPLRVLVAQLIPLGSTGFHGFYFRVAPDGHVEELAEVNRDGTAQRLSTKGFDKERTLVYTCADKPVEYETVQVEWPLRWGPPIF